VRITYRDQVTEKLSDWAAWW